jgi:predicted transcriptional regulator
MTTKRASQSVIGRALGLLGPREGEIMAAAWSRRLPTPFVVRDVAELLPDLAYTTVMTTVQRLAAKSLLAGAPRGGPHGHQYTVRESPEEFLRRMSNAEAKAAVDRFGDAALAAFAAQLDSLTADQRARLKGLAEGRGT